MFERFSFKSLAENALQPSERFDLNAQKKISLHQDFKNCIIDLKLTNWNRMLVYQGCFGAFLNKNPLEDSPTISLLTALSLTVMGKFWPKKTVSSASVAKRLDGFK